LRRNNILSFFEDLFSFSNLLLHYIFTTFQISLWFSILNNYYMTSKIQRCRALLPPERYILLKSKLTFSRGINAFVSQLQVYCTVFLARITRLSAIVTVVAQIFLDHSLTAGKFLLVPSTMRMSLPLHIS